MFGGSHLPDNLNLLDDPGSLLRLARSDHVNYWYLKRDPPLPIFTPTQPFQSPQSDLPIRSDLFYLTGPPKNIAWNLSNPCCAKYMLPSPTTLGTLSTHTEVRAAVIIWTPQRWALWADTAGNKIDFYTIFWIWILGIILSNVIFKLLHSDKKWKCMKL